MAGQVQWRGPTIITDGLLFYMNSSSPSCYNTSSYFGGGSTLRNISGFTSYSGSLTLVNNTTNNNYSGGNVFTFPSSTSNINLGDPTELRLGTGSFTISVWARPTDTNGIPLIVNKRNTILQFPSIWLGQGGWAGNLNPTSTKQINAGVRFDGSNQYVIYTTSNIVNGDWKHIVFLRDSLAATPFIKIYINNIDTPYIIHRENGTGVLSNIDIPTVPWVIGNISPTLTGFNANFPISSVQIYNRALSTDELTFNYNNSKALYGL
jgi:hypothetical protein